MTTVASGLCTSAPALVERAIGIKPNAATAANKSRHEHTPSDTPQREDLIMKPKKERAAPAQREKKIASLSTILAEKHRIPPCERTVPARNPSPQSQLTRRIAERAMALSPVCFHPSCMSPKRAHSTATFQTTERRNNQHSLPASRRSPSSTTRVLAPKAPAGTLQ
jgi:hypothetical protein